MKCINDTALMPIYPRGIHKFLPSKSSRGAFKQFFVEYLANYKPDVVFFHQLFDTRWNSAFQYVKAHNPKVQTFLLPDGMLNTAKRPLSKKDIRKQHLRRWYGSLISFPYHLYQGDWTGIDDPCIRKIWIPTGFPNKYAENQCHYFDCKKKHLKDKKIVSTQRKKALFLDQPVVDRKIINQQQHDAILHSIDAYFSEKNIDVYYKSHPKMSVVAPPETFKLLALKSEELLENHILEEDYCYISSFFTTSLLMNVLASNDKKFISFDTQGFFKQKYSSIYTTLGKAGVSYVNL